MTFKKRKSQMLVLLLCMIMVSIACSDQAEDSLEQAGENIKDAAESTADKIEKQF